jgi:flagellar biogenesis protein FliO
MFSPVKIIVVIALIAVVWYGFKAMGRVRAKAAKVDDASDHDNIEDNR